MKIIIIELDRKADINEIISALGNIGCLWSIKENTMTILTENGVKDEILAALIALKVSKIGIYVKQLTIVDFEENTVKTLIEHMRFKTGSTMKFMEKAWEGKREVEAVSETPLIIRRHDNIFDILCNPSNELLKLSGLDLRRAIITRKSLKQSMFTWKAIYELKYEEALKLKMLGLLGIGELTFEGYGRFKLRILK